MIVILIGIGIGIGIDDTVVIGYDTDTDIDTVVVVVVVVVVVDDDTFAATFTHCCPYHCYFYLLFFCYSSLLGRGRPSTHVLTVVCTLIGNDHPDFFDPLMSLYTDELIPRQLANSAVNNAMLSVCARAGNVTQTVRLFRLLVKGQYNLDGPVLSGTILGL